MTKQFLAAAAVLLSAYGSNSFAAEKKASQKAFISRAARDTFEVDCIEKKVGLEGLRAKVDGNMFMDFSYNNRNIGFVGRENFASALLISKKKSANEITRTEEDQIVEAVRVCESLANAPDLKPNAVP